MQQNHHNIEALSEKELKLAKIMLVNLPNTPNMVSGIREYKNHLYMVASNHNGGVNCISLQNIIDYLEKQYPDKSETKKSLLYYNHRNLPKDEYDNLVRKFECLLFDIAGKYSDNFDDLPNGSGNNAHRMFGFDGIAAYLKQNGLNNNTQYNQMNCQVIKLTKDDFDKYSVRLNVPFYNHDMITQGTSKFMKHYEPGEIADHLNEKIGKKKYCNCCNKAETSCIESFGKETHNRHSSFCLDDDGNFKDLRTPCK